jgi:hypothetical protein
LDPADRFIAEAAGDPRRWHRRVMVDAVGHRLTDADRQRLAATTDPGVLVDAMTAAGVLAPSTMLRVLHAEGATAQVAARLAPAIGIAVPDAIGVLHNLWGADRLDIAADLAATVDELRRAGLTAAELLAAPPRNQPRSLDRRESTWERAGAILVEAGYSDAQAIAHLSAHAPTSATFAAGVSAIVDDPVTALAHSVGRSTVESLAALTEKYGLGLEETAATLVAVGAPIERAVAVVLVRNGDDLDAAIALAVGILGISRRAVASILAAPVATVVVPFTDAADRPPSLEAGTTP